MKVCFMIIIRFMNINRSFRVIPSLRLSEIDPVCVRIIEILPRYEIKNISSGFLFFSFLFYARFKNCDEKLKRWLRICSNDRGKALIKSLRFIATEMKFSTSSTLRKLTNLCLHDGARSCE